MNNNEHSSLSFSSSLTLVAKMMSLLLQIVTGRCIGTVGTDEIAAIAPVNLQGTFAAEFIFVVPRYSHCT